MDKACAAAVEAETALIAWWQELLGVDQVTPSDDFFELGGHSLIGVALFARIKNTYGIELGLSTLFEARTVRQLAEVIGHTLQSNGTDEKRVSAIVPIQPKGTRSPLFWIPGGYGTSVLAFKDVSLLLGPDQPVYGFEARMPERGVRGCIGSRPAPAGRRKSGAVAMRGNLQATVNLFRGHPERSRRISRYFRARGASVHGNVLFRKTVTRNS